MANKRAVINDVIGKGEVEIEYDLSRGTTLTAYVEDIIAEDLAIGARSGQFTTANCSGSWHVVEG